MISKEKFISMLSSVFITCLILLFFSQIFWQPIFWFNLKSYYLFDRFLNNLEAIQPGIIIITFIFGTFLLYINRDKIQDMEKEPEIELEGEKIRKNNFSEKFPKINKIPVLKSIVKWMYKEGWLYSFWLLFIVIFWFILKYYLSIHLSPENDETYTYMVVEWYNKLHVIWITPTWEMYYFTHKFFHYFTTIFYNFFYDNS